MGSFSYWPEAILYLMVSCSVCKPGGKLVGGWLGIGDLVASDHFPLTSLVFISFSFKLIYIFF